jgi:hypothetical protein
LYLTRDAGIATVMISLPLCEPANWLDADQRRNHLIYGGMLAEKDGQYSMHPVIVMRIPPQDAENHRPMR